MIHARSLPGPCVPCHQAKKGLHVNLDFAEGPAGPDAFTIKNNIHLAFRKGCVWRHLKKSMLYAGMHHCFNIYTHVVYIHIHNLTQVSGL